MGADFIDKMKLIRQRRQDVERVLRKGGPHGLYPVGFPFAVVERLFFRDKVKRVSSRDTMLPLTLSPSSVLTRPHNSSSEISAWPFTASRKNDAWGANTRATPPACGDAATLPVSRLRRVHLSIVGSLMSSVSAIWRLDCLSWATAA